MNYTQHCKQHTKLICKVPLKFEPMHELKKKFPTPHLESRKSTCLYHTIHKHFLVSYLSIATKKEYLCFQTHTPPEIKMTHDAKDALIMLHSFSHHFGMNPDSVTATQLARMFLTMQTHDVVFEKVADVCLSTEERNILDSYPVQFARYHLRNIKWGNEMEASVEEESVRQHNMNEDEIKQERIARQVARQLPAKFGGKQWNSLFHFLELPKHLTQNTEESRKSMFKTIPTYAYFQRDISNSFGKKVAQNVYIPLFYLSQLPVNNLTLVLNEWNESEIDPKIARRLHTFLIKWNSPQFEAQILEDRKREYVSTIDVERAERSHSHIEDDNFASDIAEFIKNVEFPESINYLVRRRERERRLKIEREGSCTVPRAGIRDTYESRLKTQTYIAADTMTIFNTVAVAQFADGVGLSPATPEKVQNMLFLFSQIPGTEDNLKSFYDAEEGMDSDLLQAIMNYVNARPHVDAADWKEYMYEVFDVRDESGHMALQIEIPSYSSGRERHNILKFGHADTFFSNIKKFLPHNVASSKNRANTFARMYTAYADDWQEKWEEMFEDVGDDLEQEITQFRENYPVISHLEMHAMVNSAFE